MQRVHRATVAAQAHYRCGRVHYFLIVQFLKLALGRHSSRPWQPSVTFAPGTRQHSLPSAQCSGNPTGVLQQNAPPLPVAPPYSYGVEAGQRHAGSVGGQSAALPVRQHPTEAQLAAKSPTAPQQSEGGACVLLLLRTFSVLAVSEVRKVPRNPR